MIPGGCKLVAGVWNGVPFRGFQCSHIEERWPELLCELEAEPEERPANLTPQLRSRWRVEHLGMDVNQLADGCDRRRC